MLLRKFTEVINCFICIVLLYQPTIALSVQDMAGLCQEWTSVLKDRTFYNLQSHSISVNCKFNISIIRLFVADEHQNVLFTVYVPSSHIDIAPVLLHLSDTMNWDESDMPQRGQRNIHVVCLSQGMLMAQDACSDNFPGVRIPAYEEVYLVSFRKESEHSNETAEVQDWFELYSLGDCLVVKRLKIFHVRILNVDYIDTTELLRLSYRRDDLRLSPVRIVAQKELGYEKFFDLDIVNGSTVFKGGTQYQMSLDYKFMLNFTYIPVFGMGWPIKLSRNGTCLNGVGEQFADKDADFMGISATWTELRAQKLSFMPAVAYAEHGIFYNGRSAQISNRELLLLPFEIDIWMVIGLAFLTLLLSSAVIGWVVRRFHLQNTSAGGVSMWVIGALLSQGRDINQATLSIRTVAFTAAVTSSLLYNAYTGAFLASVSSPPSALKSFDAFKKLNFTVFTDPDLIAFVEDYIKVPEQFDTICKWEETKLNEWCQNSDDRLKLERNSRQLYKGMNSLVQRVLEPTMRLACLYRLDGFYGTALALNLSSKEFCEISFVPASRQSRRLESFLIRKGWPYRELFTQKTVMLIERGLSRLYFHTFLRETQPPCILTWKYENMISIDQCHGAFGILIVGACIAFTGFCAERLYKWVRVKLYYNKNLWIN